MTNRQTVRLIAGTDIALAPRALPAVTEARLLAESAAQILRQIERGEYPPERIDSATWRLADALLSLGQYAHIRWPTVPTPGVDEPTGRGAMLSKASP